MEMMKLVRDKEGKYLSKSSKTSASPQNTEASTSSGIGINSYKYEIAYMS